MIIMGKRNFLAGEQAMATLLLQIKERIDNMSKRSNLVNF